MVKKGVRDGPSWPKLLGTNVNAVRVGQNYTCSTEHQKAGKCCRKLALLSVIDWYMVVTAEERGQAAGDDKQVGISR